MNNSLFNNPLVNQARKQMSPEELKLKESLGKEMFDTVDFETSTINNPKEDAFQKILNYLNSGLDVQYLSPDEIKILEEHLGKDWKQEIINN